VTDEQQQAIDGVRATFSEHAVDVDELADGSAWVIVRGVDIGPGWNQPRIDLAVKLLITFPHAPYPFYGPAGLARVEGNATNPVPANADIGDGVMRSQISLRIASLPVETFDTTTETVAGRLVWVMAWLRNPT
jgi:hypothetical protein